jgi:hypothetical protein
MPTAVSPSAVKPANSRASTGQRAALAAALAAEWALFATFTRRHFAWVYPRWLDQQQYLLEAYRSYDRMRTSGFLSAARHALGTLSPQGSLHGVLALVAFAIAGPSRDAALAVNIVAFIALQAAMFGAVRKVAGSSALAWAAVFLLAAMHSPWSDTPGSASDFRLDWLGACAYGVALCAAVAADGFRSTRGSIRFGIAVAVAVMARHLTAAYCGLIFAALLAWLLLQPGRTRLCGRWALSAAIALALSGWAFWRGWANIYSYYWVERFGGAEGAIRDTPMSPLGYLRWLLSQLVLQQVGIAAVLLAVGVAAALFLVGRKAHGSPADPAETAPSPWPVVLIFLAAPAAVFLFHPVKAPQPLNVLIPPAAWLIVLLWVRLSRQVPRRSLVPISACAALAGCGLFVFAEAREPYAPATESEYRKLGALSDFLYFRAQESGLSRPRVASTWIFDGLIGASFEVLGRERHGQPLPFEAPLPTGVLADDRGDVMTRLAGSDFVCLVTRAEPNWPFDREMLSMLPAMRQWCDGNLVHDGDLESADIAVSIYERRGLAHPGPRQGVDLSEMIAAAAKGGPDAPAHLPGPAHLTAPDRVAWTTQGEFRFIVRAAYSPLRFHAEGLPPGLSMDSGTGEIRGFFKAPGKYPAVVTAQNAAGSDSKEIELVVGEAPWEMSVGSPGEVGAGEPASIVFSAYDSQGMLDFVDLTDLTTSRFIARIAANDDERREWRGSCEVVLREPGKHTIELRCVRYDPAGSGTYSFGDRMVVVGVRP